MRPASSRFRPRRRDRPSCLLPPARPRRPAVLEIRSCCGRRSRNCDRKSKQQQQEIDELTAGLRRIEDEFQDLKRALGG